LGYFGCSLILVYLVPLSAKINHAKIKQTPKIKTPKSLTVMNAKISQFTVIRCRNSKDRQCNGQKKKDTETNNGRQNNTQKTKD
jgi:hypothetical protein